MMKLRIVTEQDIARVVDGAADRETRLSVLCGLGDDPRVGQELL